MAEYIEREKTVLQLLEKGQASRRYKLGDVWELNFDEIREAIASIPAADVRPVVKAEWLPFGKRGIYGMMYACSACHAKYDGRTNFCPNCGADMGAKR